MTDEGEQQRQFSLRNTAHLENARVSRVESPCWMCRGEQLEAQDGAARVALCDTHLRLRVRLIMGLVA